MVYCSKCGKKNEDAAEYCAKCGASLTATKKEHEKEWDKRCEEECPAGKGRGQALFWGIIIVLIGLVIIFEGVLKNLDIPGFEWTKTVNFGLIFAAVIGIVIILWGLRLISRH